ncbi:MAG: CHAT domain-containing protein [Saprospiraceae bacterium]|nr:CHAT domain-containing protein [Saprospiraceae bacterium]
MIKIKSICLLILIPLFGFSQIKDTTKISKKIDSLLLESQAFIETHNLDLAFKKLSLAKTICIDSIGTNSSQYGLICYKFGNYFEEVGDYPNAEKWYQSAFEIQSQFQEQQSLEFANTLNSLAGIYADLAQVDKAKPMYEKALAIREKKLGKLHPDYARVLNNLAGISQYTGAYEKAILQFQEAQQIYATSLGTKHVHYALTLNNLANVYFDIGNFNQAELLYSEALSIRENSFGRNNPKCAESINCLGNLYSAMGLKEKALKYYQEALSININTVGENNFGTANCMINIAVICTEMEQYEKAESYFLKSIEILKNTIGIENPEYATTLDNMANMYMAKHTYDKAEKLYLEALKIRETVLGVEHPEYAWSLNNLGSFYSVQNKPKVAEPYIIKAKEVLENIFGNEHPDYLLGLNNLIIHYWLINRNKELVEKFTESVNIEKKLVFGASRHLSENELAQYINGFTRTLDRLFSFNNLTKQLNSLCYNNLLFYKGYLLNATANLSRLVSLDTIHLNIYNELKKYHQDLGKELSLPIAIRSFDKIKLLEENVNTLEKELARKLLGLHEPQKDIVYQDILNHLKPNEAAVEFIHFNLVDPLPTNKTIYAALILKKDLPEPIFVQLFEQKALDSLLQTNNGRRSEYVNSLYSISERGIKTQIQHKNNLADLIWKPLEKELVGIKTIYYSSSGLLHRINLDAIPINEAATISDSFHLIALGSTRQLLSPTNINFKNNSAILFGGINFEEDSTNIQFKEDAAKSATKNSDQTVASIEKFINFWEYLPGTEREVNALEKIIQKSGINTTLIKGFNATEESFKKIGTNNKPSPRILHIATHGYFFEDLIKSSQKSEINSQKENVFTISDHPMLRSGIIMAGGNAAWQGKQTLEGREDGILTAYEISQMNLSNTELVVLSACETGLGDIQGNEGVYGLQRAFKIAGAKYLIMSLWQVPDKQTSLLMTTFYKKWLEAEGPDKVGNKMTIPDAFHAAQKELRENGLDPYNWAGFVLVE